MQHQVLVPIDGDRATTERVIAQAIRIHRQEGAAVHLLNVQPPVSSHVAMFFGTHELHELQREIGEEELAPAKALLAAAGVPCTSEVLIGRSAPTIAGSAQRLSCDRVVIPKRGASVFGSLAQQVGALLTGAGAQVIAA